MKLEKKYQEPYVAWQQMPNPMTTGALLSAVDPVINTALRSYAGGDTGPILRSRARRIAIDSLPRYNPEKAQLSTFLMQQLQGLLRAKAQVESPIQVPELIRLQQQQMRDAHTILIDRLGRDPSSMELSDHLRLPLKRVAQLQRVSSGVPEGLLRNQHGGQGDDDQVFAPAVAGRPNGDQAWAELIYHGLDPTDQVILEHSAGLFGKPRLSNQLIARKLNVSPSAISQRRLRIQQQLDMRDDLAGGL